MSFFFEVLIGGLLSGVMYSLVALGFVLIYKASGVFNFAQGAMVFFAALTYVGLLEVGLSPWLAVPATLVVMIILALLTERVVLRPLVNQPQITLFMATIGLTFFIEGLAQMVWGANVRGLDLGLQYALTFVALKALPVLILGGFDSIPGAIVGGLIIGASEKLAEVYLGPYVGGGIEGWFPYVLALVFLLIRPEGLFGEKIIRRI